MFLQKTWSRKILTERTGDAGVVNALVGDLVRGQGCLSLCVLSGKPGVARFDREDRAMPGVVTN